MLHAELATDCSQRNGSGNLNLNLTCGAVHILCLQAKQEMAERNGRQDRSQALLEWHKVGLSCSTVLFSIKTVGTHQLPTMYSTISTHQLCSHVNMRLIYLCCCCITHESRIIDAVGAPRLALACMQANAA
jgi:hypothetical protein